MELWKRRAINTVVAVVALIFVSSFVYHYIMIAFEGRSPSYFNSLRAVVETYTGTGYGADSPWDTPVANIFVTVLDLSTFLLVFIIVPYVLSPVLEEALSPTPPTSTGLSGHTVVCDYTERTEKLVDEFENRNADYVVIVGDEERAIDLMEEDVDVVCGDPSSAEDLRRVNVSEASSVVVDTEDRESASVVLAVTEVNPDARVVVLVRDMSLERYLKYAGADAVLTPRRLLGRRIAERVRTEISPRLSDSVRISSNFALVELTVLEESPVSGETLRETGLLDDPEVSVPALWKSGEFIASPSPDTKIGDDTVLLAVGKEESLRRMESTVYSGTDAEALVVVAGFGEVGSTVSRNLSLGDVNCTVIDVEDMEDVDVVGDATEEEVLREAGIEDASAFVSTVQGDDVAILSVLVVSELESDLDVLARVNSSENENKIRRAGADYVLSLPDISGRMLASEVLREEMLSYDRQLRVVRLRVSEFAGEKVSETPLSDAEIAVVAVDRDDDVVTDVPDSFVFEEGDEVFIAGSDAAVDEYASEFSGV
jgi:Trk K+ transport system NAD-binding subunit